MSIRNGVRVALVAIPKIATSSLDALRRSERRTKFLEEITKVIDPANEATDDTRKLFCSLLATDPDYEVPFRETAHSEGFYLTCPPRR